MTSRLNRHSLINTALMLVSCSLLVACGGGPMPIPKAAPAKDDDSKSVKVPPFPGKRYVLLVGVQAYGSPEFPDLSFTENDVDELTTAMTQSGYSRENITVLTKNKAVPRDILQKLKVIADKCTKDDVLFVGFAGHGFERPNPSNPDQRQQFFCGYGARKDQPDTLVDLDQVYRILGDSRAGMKLIVMDACRNSLDRSLPPTDPGHSSITSGNIPQGVLAFFSSSSGQRSFESPSLKHGVFFHFLIEAFQGKAQTRNGQLTWTDLIAHLNDHVTKYVKSELKQSQDWHFQGNVNIHLPLAEVAGPTPPPKPTATVDTKQPQVSITQTYNVNRPIQSWSDRILITLEKIELQNNHRMRWYFTFWNKFGKDQGMGIRPASYVVDQNGKQSIWLSSSGNIFGVNMPNGVKLEYWVEFQGLYPEAKVLTAHFVRDANLSDGGLPETTVDLDDPDSAKAKAKVAQEEEDRRKAKEKAAKEKEDIRIAEEEEKRKRDLLPKRPGELILRTKVAIRKDVTAWVEVDGKREADWKVGTTEVKLSLLSGAHRVVVKSISQKKEMTIVDKEIEVVADKSTTIDVGP